MPPRIFPTTEILQARMVAEADKETLILTSGGRLARQMRHAFRMERREGGHPGWCPPRIKSLNDWIEETWRKDWPEESLASPLKILGLWEKAVHGTGLPQGLTADMALYRILDETFQARIRNKVPSFKEGYAGSLILWREEVFTRFARLLLEQGLLHPVVLPIKVLQQLLVRPGPFPGKIFLAGFEFPAPIEWDLLKELKEHFGATAWLTKAAGEPVQSAVSLPNQEEEVIWLCEQVLSEARHRPLHRIALVVPSLSQYATQFSEAFRDLIGQSTSEEAGNYNISLGQVLLNQPLIQAGLLPLRFFLEEEPRTLLLSLFLSPYYGRWKSNRSLMAQADSLWRKQGLDKGLKPLLQCLNLLNFKEVSALEPEGQALETVLESLNRPQQTGADWVESLKRCWQVLRFPSIALTGEEGIYQHLLEVLRSLSHELKTVPMDGPTFWTWLKYGLAQTLVNEPGYEQAGIQVLGLIEARGLAFDRLFLAGMSKGSLPQPVRTFPFLTPEERRLVQGAGLKSQYEFAFITFEHLKSISPVMTMTRPEEEQGNPLPPSPFWPEKSEKKERNVWMTPGKVWSRAEWLKQTAQGMKKMRETFPREDLPLQSIALPDALSVTAVESALSCPFKYFAQGLLKIIPLEEINIGISPPERGEVLHKILALITRTIRRQKTALTDEEGLSLIVHHCVQEVLKAKSHDPHWQIEQRRLIGEEKVLKGLLGVWLEQEKKRWEEGWRWETEEMAFSDLTLPSWSFSIQGRIDRVDINEKLEQVCCWDYKTGSIPQTKAIIEKFSAPQLPLYLWALKGRPDYREKFLEAFKAGYVGLKSEGEAVIQEPLKETAAWALCLTDWEREIAELGKKLLGGKFFADPRPEPRSKNEGACAYCPYGSLCTYWKSDRR
jgi:ATP-dependent helicase/nuclease subunit B